MLLPGGLERSQAIKLMQRLLKFLPVGFLGVRALAEAEDLQSLRMPEFGLQDFQAVPLQNFDSPSKF